MLRTSRSDATTAYGAMKWLYLKVNNRRSDKAFNVSYHLLQVVGFDMTRKAVEKLEKQTGFKPADTQVIELHDCFSANELITYEALGLCGIGKSVFIWYSLPAVDCG